MERRARQNLWLLAAVMVAGWLVWRDISAPSPAPSAVARVTSLDPGTVSRLTISRDGGGDVLDFVRESGRWWLLRDPRLPADGLRIGEVLRLVDAVSETSYAVDEVDAHAIGIAPPRVRVHVDGVELRIGAQEPLNYRRYVASGERVHLVTDTAYVHLGADWIAFVDPAPLAGLPELRSIERVSSDGEERLPEEQVTAWRELAADEVRGVVAPDASPAALTFRFSDGSSRQLIAWRKAQVWWLAWSDGVVSYAIPPKRGPGLGLE